jgi:WD40 repeat protein
LLVSGELSLGLITRDTWELNYSKDFTHKKPITCITWINETVFATAALDKLIKIWDYSKRTFLNFIMA